MSFSFLLILLVLCSNTYTPLRSAPSISTQEGLQPACRQIFEEKRHAVVSVYAIFNAQSIPTENTSDKDKPEKVHAQHQGATNLVETATGCIISKSGLIMTTGEFLRHGFPDEFLVKYQNKPYKAELLGHDVKTNLAILQIVEVDKNKVFHFIQLSDSLELTKPATLLLPITCKLGLTAGASFGILTHNISRLPNKIFPTTYSLTNIALEGAEAGSPVFDLQGKLVGLLMIGIEKSNTSCIIPTRVLLRVRDDLLFSGKVSYAYLGIDLDPYSAEYGLGLTVQKIVKDSPAEVAGLVPGDQILEFNNTPLTDVSDFQNAMFFSKPEQVALLKVQRGNKIVVLKAKLAEAK